MNLTEEVRGRFSTVNLSLPIATAWGKRLMKEVDERNCKLTKGDFHVDKLACSFESENLSLKDFQNECGATY